MAEQCDLLVLVADRSMEAAVRGILERGPKALAMRQITFDIRVHPRYDSGCLNQGVEYFRPFALMYRYALLLFDHDGCGQERTAATLLEDALQKEFQKAGWTDRACVIILDPELDIWVWSDSPHVDRALGWIGKSPGLRSWLQTQGLWRPDQPKPDHPKEAVKAALRAVNLHPSAAIFKKIADKVSLAHCRDRAFLRLKATLQTWFGAS